MAVRSNTTGQHTAGIFADMTVDGPEIGTLVVIVDRAKNLPNRRTMGKQNPYCAARLGKEAKKTDTDLRGGQTPKWDQELRFTVHDSPDYNNLKISVFSEDKRTDLIGEAWLSLTEVIVPGGGKCDLWQGLNCKGKYAGELRVEMTFYDSRPKPVTSKETELVEEELRTSTGGGARVKRRPLPTNPLPPGAITPSTIPDLPIPGRARHGPRDLRTPTRASTMPPDVPHTHHSPHTTMPLAPQQQQPPHHHHHYGQHSNGPPYDSSLPVHAQQDFQQDHHSARQDPHSFHEQEHYVPQHLQQHISQYRQEEQFRQPDFLPELPPSDRQRLQTRVNPQHVPTPTFVHGPPQSIPLPGHTTYAQISPIHSNSSPTLPYPRQGEENLDHLSTEYPDPPVDIDHLHDDMNNQRWHDQGIEPDRGQYQHYPQAPSFHDGTQPPPPPVHSNSAPAIPQSSSPYNHIQQPFASRQSGMILNTRHHHSSSGPIASPVYTQHQTPTHVQHPQDAPMSENPNDYSSPPAPFAYGAHRQTPPSLTRPMPHRHSVADPYALAAPSRPHPISQERPRAWSPQPTRESVGVTPQAYEAPYHAEKYTNNPLQLPRTTSPNPMQEPKPAPRAHNTYSIRFPVRAFESSDSNPLSRSVPQDKIPASTARKSVSPRPSISGGLNPSAPYGPDSFEVHNPNIRASTLPHAANSRSPYHIKSDEAAREVPRGPIVGWHGQEIDPSDHLPVDSWAPEPERKTPTKTYAVGRDKDFGPRPALGISTTNGRVSRDMVVNVRRKHYAEHQPDPSASSSPASSSLLNRLRKKSTSSSNNNGPVMPLQEHDNFNSVPNPYATPDYARGYKDNSPVTASGYHPEVYESPYHSTSPVGYDDPYVSRTSPGQQQDYHDQNALAQDLSSIDLGPSPSAARGQRAGHVPSPVAYVPVRSHRDRNTFY